MSDVRFQRETHIQFFKLLKGEKKIMVKLSLCKEKKNEGRRKGRQGLEDKDYEEDSG